MRTRITTIKGASLKGRTFTDSIEPVTVFVGANGAGKTARIDAILLALAGQHPKLGKQNAALFRLSSGSVMAAHVSLSDGQFVERSWTERKGSISMERNGCDLNVPPVALDAGEYFSLSERERLALVFRLSESAPRDFGPELAAKVKGIKLETATPESEKMLVKIADEIMGQWQSKDGNDAQWLDTFAAFAKSKKAEATAAAKRMTGTVAGITELRAQASAPSQDAEREREKAAQAVVALNTEFDRLTQRLAADDENLKRKHALAGEIETLRSLSAGLSDQQRQKDALEAATANASPAAPEAEGRLREAMQALNTVKASITQLQDELRKAEQQTAARSQFEAILDPTGENETALMKADEFVKFNGDKLRSYRSRVPACEQAVNSANNLEFRTSEAVADAESDLEQSYKERERLAHIESCPYCKSAGDGWKATLAEQLAANIADEQKALDDAKAAHEQAKAAVAKAARELEAAREEQDVHANLMQALTVSERKLEQTIAEKRRAEEGIKLLTSRSALAIAADLEAVMKDEAAVKATFDAARTACEAARKADSELFSKRSALTRLRSDLAAVPDYPAMIARKEGELSALPSPLDRAACQTHRTALAESLTAAKAKLEQAKQKAAQLVASRAEAAAKLRAAEAAEATRAEATAWEAVREFVDVLQGEAVERAFKPLLTVANRIAGAVLKSPLMYRAGEIGRMDGRTWISHQTFSGSEQAVTYAALSVALAAASPLRVAIIDEMDRLTPENKKTLMESVVEAVNEDVLDQCICCDVRASDYYGLVGVFVKPV